MSERYTIQDGILTVKNGVEEIYHEEFEGNTEFHTVKLPDSVISIENSAFQKCKNLKKIYLPRSLIKIGNGAFYNTPIYDDFEKNEANELYIDSYLIRINTTLTGVYKVKEGTKVIADGAFSNCSALDKIILSESVYSIGRRAFAGCRDIKNILLSRDLKRIGEEAFEGCMMLKEILIPDMVDEIDYNAFGMNNNLVIFCKKNSYADKNSYLYIPREYEDLVKIKYIE